VTPDHDYSPNGTRVACCLIPLILAGIFFATLTAFVILALILL